MKVLFATSEAYPFAVSGGLGDVAYALPKALRKKKVGVRVVMPLYKKISDELRSEMTFIKSISVPVSWRTQYCGIFEAKHDGITFIFIDNEYYFKRDNMYGDFMQEIGHQLLHCRRCFFEHPVTGEKMSFEGKYYEDFARTNADLTEKPY